MPRKPAGLKYLKPYAFRLEADEANVIDEIIESFPGQPVGTALRNFLMLPEVQNLIRSRVQAHRALQALTSGSPRSTS